MISYQWIRIVFKNPKIKSKSPMDILVPLKKVVLPFIDANVPYNTSVPIARHHGAT